MSERRYRVVDVFAEEALAGNPLAVVLDGEGLSTEQMQAYANWTSLSETTFLLPPTDPAADYRVRIFTPDIELPFAGHPTLGSCMAWLDGGGRPSGPDGVVTQECGVGLVELRVRNGRPAFCAPPLIRSGPLDEATLAEVLGELGLEPTAVVDAAWIDNGPGWLGLLLPDVETMLAVRPVPSITHDIGLVAFHPDQHRFAYEVRAFFRKFGMTAEDPVTGSLNASVAQWLLASGRVVAPYTATQGTALGRAGRIEVSTSDPGQAGGEPSVWIGGAVAVVVRGTVELGSVTSGVG